MFDSRKIREDFPVLSQKRNNLPPIYLDSACMSLKPRPVIDAQQAYYEQFTACSARSDHWFASETSQKVEQTRTRIAQFLNSQPQEIVFTKNTTEGINLLAYQFRTTTDNVVIISDKEHNSNFLPWKRLEQEGHTVLVIIPTDEQGQLDLGALEAALQTHEAKQHKLVSLVGTSNLDGVTYPIETIVALAKRFGFHIHIDAAQTIPHRPLDVQALGVDYITFSGHKILGPTGTGVLWGRQQLLEKMAPLVVGGGMAFDATYDNVTYQEPPARFEAGLQNYAGIIGLRAAIDYVQELLHIPTVIEEHVQSLNTYTSQKLQALSDRVRITGPQDASARAGILSFEVHGIDHHQIAYILNDQANVMVRAGRHCVQGYTNSRDIAGTVRVSFYIYNTQEECDTFLDVMEKIMKL